MSNAQQNLNISQITAKQALEQLKSQESGLTEQESQARQKQFGKNAIKQEKRFVSLKQFVSLIAVLLWIAGAFALIAEMPQLAIATWFIVIVNGIFSFLQEYKADKAISKLSNILPNMVKVTRNELQVLVNAQDLVIGDIITLESGDVVPADCRVISAEGFYVNISKLSAYPILTYSSKEGFVKI